MDDSTYQNSKFWLIPEFNNLELFRAKAIHHTYTRHSHAGYSIGIIEDGVGGNFYQGSTYLAPPSSIIFMNPEEVHTGYAVNDLPLTYRMLYPSVNLIQELIGEMQTYKFAYFKEAVVQDKTLARNICYLHTVLEKCHDCLEKQSLLVEVFSAVFCRYADTKIKPAKLGNEQRIVSSIKDYLQDNFRSNISLKQLADLTNLNRSYLIRVFRKAVGMPPYTYLNQIRVEQAKLLLMQGTAIADVAAAVGMSDQSHLNRHFKRIVGITPGRFRSMSISFNT